MQECPSATKGLRLKHRTFEQATAYLSVDKERERGLVLRENISKSEVERDK